MTHNQQKVSDAAHAVAKGRERNSREYASVLSDSSATMGHYDSPTPLRMEAVVGRETMVSCHC